jgi:hypothetical protein
MHNIIHNNIQPYYDEFLPPDEKILKENYQDLCDIFESVKNRQGSKACDLAQKHVRQFYKYMIAQNTQPN